MSIDSVDNNAGTTRPPENISQNGMKSGVLKESIPLVTGRIERVMDLTEVRALGYVLDKRWSPEQPLSTGKFISDTLGLDKEDISHKAEMKISRSVSEVLRVDYESRLAAAAVSDPAEHAKLKALWRIIEMGDNLTNEAFQRGVSEIHLGGVPEYWLPDWVKTFNQQASTPK